MLKSIHMVGYNNDESIRGIGSRKNLRNSYQCSSLTYTPQYESKVAKKFKRIS